jgi:hypothetical protein
LSAGITRRILLQLARDRRREPLRRRHAGRLRSPAMRLERHVVDLDGHAPTQGVLPRSSAEDAPVRLQNTNPSSRSFR